MAVVSGRSAGNRGHYGGRDILRGRLARSGPPRAAGSHGHAGGPRRSPIVGENLASPQICRARVRASRAGGLGVAADAAPFTATFLATCTLVTLVMWRRRAAGRSLR